MAESFFHRWARRKVETRQSADGIADETRTSPVTDGEVKPGARSVPTLQDVKILDSNSDYSVFIAKGVDKTVRRAAMKKLFSDPHFNVMDGLDIYIDDYTKASPLSPAMLAALQHAKNVLNPTPVTDRQAHLPTDDTIALDAAEAMPAQASQTVEVTQIELQCAQPETITDATLQEPPSERPENRLDHAVPPLDQPATPPLS